RLERFLEALARRPRELRDRLPQILERLLEVAPLLREELVTLAHLLVLGHRTGVHVAQAHDACTDLLRPGRLVPVDEDLGVALDLGERLEPDRVALEQALAQTVDREPPLGHDPLAVCALLAQRLDRRPRLAVLAVLGRELAIGGGDLLAQTGAFLREPRAPPGGLDARLVGRLLLARRRRDGLTTFEPDGLRLAQPLLELGHDPCRDAARRLGRPRPLRGLRRADGQLGVRALAMRDLLAP